MGSLFRGKIIYRDSDIDILGLSARATNCLKRSGCHTVEDLLNLPEKKIIKIHNVGVKTIAEIEAVKKEIIEPKDFEPNENDSKKNYYNALTSIQELDLSVRSINCLKRFGVWNIGELYNLDIKAFSRFRNTGTKTIEEVNAIQSRLKKDKNVYGLGDSSPETGEIDEISKQVLELFSSTQNELYKVEINDIRKVIIDHTISLYGGLEEQITVTNDVISRLIDGDYFNMLFQQAVMRLGGDEEKITQDILDQVFSERLQCLKKRYINRWLKEHFLEKEDDYYFVSHLSALDFCNKITNERDKDILLMRLNHCTLEEIGKKYNVTREYIRQKLRKILSKRPRLLEDRFIPLFIRYDFTEEAFCTITELHHTSYGYLEIITTRGNQDLEGILKDDLPVYMLINAEKYIYRNYVEVDGVRLKAEKQAIAKYLLRQYKTPVVEDAIYKKYIKFVNNNFPNKPELLNITPRYFTTTLARQEEVLLLSGRRIVFTDITSEDVPELLEKIKFYELKDIEISTQFFIDRYPEVMKEYSINSAYELHNLLKKHISDDNIQFGRQPTLIIGNGDRDKQVLELFIEEAPISSKDLAKKYRDEYGVDEGTVAANFFKGIDPYFEKGVFSIDYEELTKEEDDALSKVLSDDVMSIPIVQKEYSKLMPGHDLRKLNSYNYKLHHYQTNGDLLINIQKYSSLDSFINGLINMDNIDISDKPWLMQNQSIYYRILREQKQWHIFEIEKLKYVSYRSIKDKGFNKEKLFGFCDDVKQFAQGNIFTIQSLQTDGFSFPNMDLETPECFWDSVLYGSGYFARQTIGYRWIYKESSESIIEGSDLVKEIIDKYSSIFVEDLLEVLHFDYGITINSNKAITLAKRANLFYSSARKKIYTSYDRYYDEL